MTDLFIGADADIDVDWDDAGDFSHTLATVTNNLDALDYRWGALRRSNPQRPLLDPGSGSMTLTGDVFAEPSARLTEAQLRGRHRFRIRHNPRTGGTVPGDVTGWCIREDRTTASRAAGRVSVWRLVGALDDDVRAEIAVTQPASPLASNSAAFATMLTAAVGQAVTVVSPVVSLGAFNFAGRRGEFISEIARVLASTPYAGRSGAVSIVAAAHQTQQARLAGDTVAVLAVTSQTDIAQIFNQLTSVEAAAMTGETRRIEVPLELIPATMTGPPVTAIETLPVMLTAQFASLGNDWTYTVAAPTQIGLRVGGPVRWERYYEPFFRRFQWRVRSGGLSTPATVLVGCTATALINVRTVTVTVTAVATGTLTRDWRKYVGSDLLATQRVTMTVPWANLGSGDTLLNRYPIGYQGNFTSWAALLTAAGFRNMSNTTYNATAPATVEATPQTAEMTAIVTARKTAAAAFSSRTVSVADSVAVWGPRPLKLPEWLQSAPAATLQSIINSFAAARQVHVIDLAMPQPTTAATARVASLEPGQLMPVRISDPRTATDINAVCVIRSVEWRLRARSRSICRVTVVETGLSATPTAPGTPRGLVVAAVAGSATQLNADCVAPAGAAVQTYRWQWRRQGTSNWSERTTTGPSIGLSSLSPATSYEVRVRAENSHGNSAWTQPVSGQTNAAAPVLAPPGTPTGLQLTPGDRQVTADWAAGSGGAAATYDLQWRQGQGSYATVRGITATSHTITGLTNGTAAQVRVRAVNASGSSNFTAPVSATPRAAVAPPATPTGLRVTPGDGRLGAAWTAVLGATDYDVQFRAGSSGAWSSWSHTGAATTATITGLANGTAYQVRVRAVNSAGPSSYTQPVSATPAAGPVRDLSALSVEDVELTVEDIELWVNQPGAPPPPDRMPTFGQATIANQAYTAGTAITDLVLPTATGGDPPVVYSLSPALPSGLTFTAGTRTVSGTPAAAAASATYTYRATDTDGDTATLTFAIAVAAALTAPGAPTALSAQPASGQVQLSWTAPVGGGAVARYRCQYRTAAVGQTPAGSWTGTRVVTSTSTTFSGLTNGTRYDLQVRSENTAGNSVWVQALGVLVAAPPPTLTGPVLRIATNLLSSNNLVQMAWTFAAPAGHTATGRYDTDVGRAFASAIQGHTDFRWDLPIRNNAATSRWLQAAGLTRLEFRVRAHVTRTADNAALVTEWATMVLVPTGSAAPSPVVVATVNAEPLSVAGVPLALADHRGS